jgi:hypothetical protein
MSRKIADHLGTFYYCDNCPILIIVEVSHKYGYVQHYFEIFYKTGSTYRIHLFKDRLQIKKITGANHSVFLELNHLPNINPTNVKQWLDRMIDLKIFF